MKEGIFFDPLNSTFYKLEKIGSDVENATYWRRTDISKDEAIKIKETMFLDEN